MSKDVLNSKFVLNKYAKERRFEESDHSLLGRLLTVRCNDMKLRTIGDLSQLKNLVKLYVRNNEIESLRNVETSPNLTHLYIINNSLYELDSVSRLSKLEKIYAGKNRIQVIEGLTNLDNLLELHIENQKLFPGEKMHLEPESLSTLKNLEVLNVSGNGLATMEFCAFLPKLVSLRCEDNNITRFNELKVLENCYELRYVHMKGNPIAKMSKYRDHIILNVKKIEQIDDKDVTRNEINFLRKWNDFRISQSQESLRLQRRHETHTLVDYGHHNGLPSGYAHVQELLKKRSDIDYSLSATHLGSNYTKPVKWSRSACQRPNSPVEGERPTVVATEINPPDPAAGDVNVLVDGGENQKQNQKPLMLVPQKNVSLERYLEDGN